MEILFSTFGSTLVILSTLLLITINHFILKKKFNIKGKIWMVCIILSLIEFINFNPMLGAMWAFNITIWLELSYKERELKNRSKKTPTN